MFRVKRFWRDRVRLTGLKFSSFAMKDLSFEEIE